jgi:predicted transposase YdaD
MGKPDTSSKKVINIYNQAWAEWVLQQQQIKVEAELSGEFQFIARATDSLLQANNPNGRFLVLTELQFRYDKRMPERLAAYAALARYKYQQPIYVTVVYFMPPAAGTSIVDTFQQEFMGQVGRQDFQPILLWEVDAEQVLAYDNPALLPFVPLMQGGGTEQMVRRCAERIRQEPQAAELETILALFAGYVLDTVLIKQILRWEMQVIQESPIIRELREQWLTKGREEGYEAGIEAGERKATIDALHQTLTIRFKVELGKFDEQFERLEVEPLKKLNEAALMVQSLKEFESVLAEMLSKLDNGHNENDAV